MLSEHKLSMVVYSFDLSPRDTALGRVLGIFLKRGRMEKQSQRGKKKMPQENIESTNPD